MTTKISITEASHLDHDINATQTSHAVASARRAIVEQGLTGLCIHTVELPEQYGTVPCGLYGPLMGDEPVPEAEVVYEVRGDREGASRLVKRPTRQVRTVTVIAGPHEGEPWVVYTVFGGPVSPREPFNVPEDDTDALAESRAFWAVHALSDG
jgi:hypothetical protein